MYRTKVQKQEDMKKIYGQLSENEEDSNTENEIDEENLTALINNIAGKLLFFITAIKLSEQIFTYAIVVKMCISVYNQFFLPICRFLHMCKKLQTFVHVQKFVHRQTLNKNMHMCKLVYMCKDYSYISYDHNHFPSFNRQSNR